jgi:hypothetical protein
MKNTSSARRNGGESPSFFLQSKPHIFIEKIVHGSDTRADSNDYKIKSKKTSKSSICSTLSSSMTLSYIFLKVAKGNQTLDLKIPMKVLL